MCISFSFALQYVHGPRKANGSKKANGYFTQICSSWSVENIVPFTAIRSYVPATLRIKWKLCENNLNALIAMQ